MDNFLQAWTTFFNQLFSGNFEVASDALGGQLTEVWNTAPLVVGVVATIFALLVLLRVVASFRIGGLKRQINALKSERNGLQGELEANTSASASLKQREEASAAETMQLKGLVAAHENELKQTRAHVQQLTDDNSTLSTTNEGLETKVDTLTSQLESRDLGQDRETLQRERRILDLERQLAEVGNRPAAPAREPQTPERPQPTLPTIQARPQVDRNAIAQSVTTCQASLRTAQQEAARVGHNGILTPLIDVNAELEKIKRATRV